ncbi:MAG: AbrB/MazE/SpoVT family DNA-binding domain-containing protein [Candidatus Bathyarchaeia archaeon]
MRIRRKIGRKGQIVIPKVIREYAGIRAGDEVIMEVREGGSNNSIRRRS